MSAHCGGCECPEGWKAVTRSLRHSRESGNPAKQANSRWCARATIPTRGPNLDPRFRGDDERSRMSESESADASDAAIQNPAGLLRSARNDVRIQSRMFTMFALTTTTGGERQPFEVSKSHSRLSRRIPTMKMRSASPSPKPVVSALGGKQTLGSERYKQPLWKRVIGRSLTFSAWSQTTKFRSQAPSRASIT